MKLKGKKLVVHTDDLHLECEEFEMEMGLEDIKEMNNYNRGSSIPFPQPEMWNTPLVYSGTLKQINVDDEVVILPQENCRTNADTIIYDDKIDGKKCIVKRIDVKRKQVTVEQEGKAKITEKSFVVMASWLEPVKIKK